MKIYCFTPNSGYSGGCFIVAANSPEEALGVIHIDKACYLADYTDIEHCKEIKELTSVNVDKPKVIINTMYVE